MIERELSWAHFIDSQNYWARRKLNGFEDYPDQLSSNETSVILLIKDVSDPRLIRNWLHDTYIGEYTLTGFWGSKLLAPAFAARFSFDNFDDKLLFALRWL